MQARDAGIPAPFTDLQALSMAQVASADAFFKTLAYSLVEQLDLDVMPEDMWTDRLGPGVNFERYVRRVALKEVDQLVWALDEVDRMFATEYASEVFGLFRSWHNKRALDPAGPWSKLTLVIAYATEAHLFIRDVNQSPFNVGTRLELGDFDESQVAELNRRYGSPLTSDEVGRFARLVGGHPYLAQRGFQALIERGMDFPTLEATGAEEDGPYGDHLRRILVLLAQNKERCDTVCDLLAGRSTPDAETFYHLRTAGRSWAVRCRTRGSATICTRHICGGTSCERSYWTRRRFWSLLRSRRDVASRSPVLRRPRRRPGVTRRPDRRRVLLHPHLATDGQVVADGPHGGPVAG
jgi:hypothetical protein